VGQYREDHDYKNEPCQSDSVVLLFSGGVDSTMAAVKLAQTHKKVHLLSYKNGYGHYRIDRTKDRAAEIARLYPGIITHKMVNVQHLFDRMLVDNLHAEYEKHGSAFVWCMGCKLAMHTATILYCVENGVYEAADGSSFATSEMVEQMPISIARIKGFYCEYGITFNNPVYEIPRSESINELKRIGFRMGLQIGDRFLGVQPKCKAGELYYMPLILRGTQPNHDPAKVESFIEEKMGWARSWVNDQIQKQGFSPDRANQQAEK
jgi:queuosine biosynthesis protein QueC